MLVSKKIMDYESRPSVILPKARGGNYNIYRGRGNQYIPKNKE